MVAVKKLKVYSSCHATSLVDAYTNAFLINHPKVCTTLGLCPNLGWIILELCQKTIGRETVHTLLDMMTVFGSEQIPVDLKVTALVDVSEVLAYLHSRGIIHGDIKPLNILACGGEEDEFTFKVTDYGCPNNSNSLQSSHSTTMKQLMTPGYMAPELLPSQTGVPLRPSKNSDIYSFAILAYELVHQKQAWDNINIGSVRSG